MPGPRDVSRYVYGSLDAAEVVDGPQSSTILFYRKICFPIYTVNGIFYLVVLI